MSNINIRKKMNNSLVIVMFTIFMICSLFGCGNKQTENSQADSEAESMESVMPSAILETKEQMGKDGTLFYVPNENIETGFMQSIACFQDAFLIYGFSGEMMESDGDNGEFCLKMISKATGEVLAHATFSNKELPNIQICEDYIAMNDWANGEIVLLDEKLQETYQYQVPCEYNSLYLSPDAEKAYVFRTDEGLQVTELASGEREALLDQAVNLFTSDAHGNKVTFSYIDKNTQLEQYASIDLEKEKITNLPFTGSFYSINHVNDVWTATRFGDKEMLYVGNEENVKVIECGDAFYSMINNPGNGNLLSVLHDDEGLSEMIIYDINGKFLSKCKNTVKGASMQGDLVWSDADRGYFFLMLDPGGKDKLMFWDMSADISGADLSFQPMEIETLTENAVSKELYEKANAIGEKYGIEIRIAEQMEEDYNDYKVEELLDEYQIRQALDVVDSALDLYPEGYLKQLLYGNIREIELHLAGTVTNLEIPEGDVNGFTSYAGFAQTRNEKAVIVVDVNEGDNMETYLHHELFHLIDDKLAFDAEIRKDAMYSEDAWMELNPEGFEYAGSTFVLPKHIYNEEYDLWFVDMYSRTMSREDRARIMEYAMMGDFNMFVAAPKRQAKLEYLNKCIRNAFDTTGWPEMTLWEETLEKSYLK